MEKHIELLKKLKALAERGIDGEKINAQALLEKLMKKHGIEMSEIEGEKVNEYFFKAEGVNVKLLNQIAKRVNRNIKCYLLDNRNVRKYKLKGNFLIDCTAAEYIEIEQMYSVFTKLYEKESDIFFTAFITANDLLTIVPKEEMRTIDDLTDEEREEWLRANKMADNIKKETIRKQLTF